VVLIKEKVKEMTWRCWRWSSSISRWSSFSVFSTALLLPIEIQRVKKELKAACLYKPLLCFAFGRVFFPSFHVISCLYYLFYIHLVPVLFFFLIYDFKKPKGLSAFSKLKGFKTFSTIILFIYLKF